MARDAGSTGLEDCAPRRYRAAAADSLRIVPLDALTLLFHRPSGMTHVVEPPVPEILETLGTGDMTADALLARLADRYALVDADPAALAVRLDELVAAGLVERLGRTA